MQAKSSSYSPGTYGLPPGAHPLSLLCEQNPAPEKIHSNQVGVLREMSFSQLPEGTRPSFIFNFAIPEKEVPLKIAMRFGALLDWFLGAPFLGLFNVLLITAAGPLFVPPLSIRHISSNTARGMA